MNAAEGPRKTRLTVDKQSRALLGVGVRLCCLRQWDGLHLSDSAPI
jgi:hypothetical protein